MPSSGTVPFASWLCLGSLADTCADTAVSEYPVLRLCGPAVTTSPAPESSPGPGPLQVESGTRGRRSSRAGSLRCVRPEAPACHTCSLLGAVCFAGAGRRGKDRDWVLGWASPELEPPPLPPGRQGWWRV